MKVLDLIKGKNELRILKTLMYFGEAQLAAQEQFSRIKSLDPQTAKTLNSKHLLSQNYDDLTPVQRQFYELFEHREKLSETLQNMDFPVLNKGFLIPQQDYQTIARLKSELDERMPLQTFFSSQRSSTFVLTTESSIHSVKSLLQENLSLESNNMCDVSSENCPILFAGMRNPVETKQLVDDISTYLKQHKLQIDEKESTCTFSA